MEPKIHPTWPKNAKGEAKGGQSSPKSREKGMPKRRAEKEPKWMPKSHGPAECAWPPFAYKEAL